MFNYGRNKNSFPYFSISLLYIQRHDSGLVIDFQSFLIPRSALVSGGGNFNVILMRLELRWVICSINIGNLFVLISNLSNNNTVKDTKAQHLGQNHSFFHEIRQNTRICSYDKFSNAYKKTTWKKILNQFIIHILFFPYLQRLSHMLIIQKLTHPSVAVVSSFTLVQLVTATINNKASNPISVQIHRPKNSRKIH